MVEILHTEDGHYTVGTDAAIIVLTTAGSVLTAQCSGLSEMQKEQLRQALSPIPDRYYPNFFSEICPILDVLGWKLTATILPDFFSDLIFRRKN